MRIFQDFTNTIIGDLERTSPGLGSMAQDGSLTTIYQDLPVFEVSSFKACVKDGTLKHPHRRTAAQHMVLHIVRMQDELKSVRNIVISAIIEVEE